MMAAAVAPLINGETHIDPRQAIVEALSTSSHSFLLPTTALHTASVLAAKRFLDPLALSVIESQEARKQEHRKKRKRADDEATVPAQVLQLREVYTEGFGIGQIWEQARRILDAATDEVERDLAGFQASKTDADDAEAKPQGINSDVKRVHFDEEGFETGSDADEDDLDDSAKVGSESEVDPEYDEDKDEHDEDGEAEDYEDIRDEDIEDIRDEDIQDTDDLTEMEQQPRMYVPDPNKLNDGFFSIVDFNRQSQFLEQQDAIGEGDNPSDEDEIDWDADPLATPLPSTSARKQVEAEQNTESEDGEGPTFGNVDLDKASDDEDEEEDDLDLEDSMPGLENTNDIKYADFFEPPAQKPSKTKRMRALPKTQPPPRPEADEKTLQDIDNDIQRAISDVRRDLLDSEDEPSSSSENDDNNPAQPTLSTTTITTKNLSTHEKQRAKITSEIRRLEAAAVAKRDWTLSGEARAADRPLNSLVEEDLEFERAGKPVPVITAEVSEEIEALIKRRIVAREFDEVVRRRPELLAGGSGVARRGRVELDDSRPSQGLADVYEAEHLKATDPGYVDKRSAALKRQHEEIARLWKDVSAKLDVLSNLHFKPKRTEVSVQVVGDKPTISMEDARPGVAEGGRGVESRLAPQEIYRPGGEGRKVKGEVMGKGGMARSREEMSKEEKLRRRRREKERAKKMKGNEAVVTQKQGEQNGGRGSHAGQAQEKRNILDELRKGGVKVIGKKGGLEEIEGKKRKGRGEAEPRSTAYKL